MSSFTEAFGAIGLIYAGLVAIVQGLNLDGFKDAPIVVVVLLFLWYMWRRDERNQQTQLEILRLVNKTVRRKDESEDG